MTGPADFLGTGDRPLVLVVDDTPENLAMMSELLRGEYRVRVARSGESALRLARAEPLPQIVLLDIMMPVMDGYEVCRRLKADPLTERIPVIFLTAKSEVEDETQGLALGFLIMPRCGIWYTTHQRRLVCVRHFRNMTNRGQRPATCRLELRWVCPSQ